MTFFPDEFEQKDGGHNDKGKAHQVGFCVANR